MIWALPEELEDRARCVHIVDCCVHTSTVGLEGQSFNFWISFYIIGGSAIETFVIWALPEELEDRERCVHIEDCCVHASTVGLEGQFF